MKGKRLGGILLNVALAGFAFALIIANVQVAGAHDWWHWHWHTGTDIETWVGGQYESVYEDVLYEWDKKTIVSFPRTLHSEMSVFDGDFGPTGWGGLSSIEVKGYDWYHHWDYSKVEHCHARVNLYYEDYWSTADIRGIQCQEVGHCLGLGHSNDGCMGKSYYNDLNHVNSHSANDVNQKFGGSPYKTPFGK